jgi:hypothetical protein
MNRSLPRTYRSSGILRVVTYFLLTAALCTSSGLSSENQDSEPTDQQLLSGRPFIYKLEPERQNGSGYKLIYMVDAPLDIYWKFKTDFDNDFLLSNKLITAHRFVSRNRNVVVTENKYSSKPNATFKWQTTVLADRQLLKFTLLNPAECGQKYHYGYIQMKAHGQATRVTQVAYFDFFGASFWVGYPLYGGMEHFLKYTAAWEQQIILKLKDRYDK